MPEIRFKWVDGADQALGLPKYETAGAAGADIRANFAKDMREAITLAPGGRAFVPTGFCLQIPEGFEVQIRGRSGLALRHGVGLTNGIGTIDSDYRGQVGVILSNHGDEAFVINHGDRIAQMVLAPVIQATFEVVETLDDTPRGKGGFGSTGVSE